MMKESLNRFVKWSGWKKIFPLPVWADVLTFGAFGVGLIWVFVNGLEMWWPSYILYVLSAYSLTALCVKLPGAVRMEKLCVVAKGVFLREETCDVGAFIHPKGGQQQPQNRQQPQGRQQHQKRIVQEGLHRKAASFPSRVRRVKAVSVMAEHTMNTRMPITEAIL